jgi:uncharacterized membrane protein YdbT with pleckstrin-like domain
MDRTRSDSTDAVLSDQPNLLLVKIGYLLPGALVATAIVGFLLPISDAAQYAIAYGTILMAFSTVITLATCHGRLRKASYTVTNDYIEARTGTFEKRVRRIPLDYIRDVTHSQNLFQSLIGLSNITVKATNGDQVTLENIRDGERKREVIWNLIVDKSTWRNYSGKPRQ